jgi:hypothetical protein
MTLNIDAMFFLSREVGKLCMIPRKGGKIINVASIAGLRGGPSDMHTIAYNTSKGAAVNFTRALAPSGAARHQRERDLPRLLPDEDGERHPRAHRRAVVSGTPLRRLGGDEDLKGVAVFLASNAARHITGQCIAVDGGRARRELREIHRHAPVAPQHAFDAERLAAGCASTSTRHGRARGRAVQGRAIESDLSRHGGRKRYALRRKPPGKLLPSAHAVDREYRVMTALADTGCPRPEDLRALRRTRR